MLSFKDNKDNLKVKNRLTRPLRKVPGDQEQGQMDTFSLHEPQLMCLIEIFGLTRFGAEVTP